MVDKLKEKFTDQKFLEKVPLFGMGLIVLLCIISVVITRIQIAGAQKELVAVQKEYDKMETKQKEETKKQESTVSALSYGKKVANLETEYSKNSGEILRLKTDYDENEIDITLDGLQDKNLDVVKSLAEYFDDNSYQDAWFPGHSSINSPYWDFGTKYNVDVSQKEIPVVWVCYDSGVGGAVLAYTTAVLNTESGKFSQARAVVTNIEEQYHTDDSKAGSGTVLGLLQATPEIPKEDATASEPSVDTEELDDVSDDVASDDMDGSEEVTE